MSFKQGIGHNSQPCQFGEGDRVEFYDGATGRFTGAVVGTRKDHDLNVRVRFEPANGFPENEEWLADYSLTKTAE